MRDQFSLSRIWLLVRSSVIANYRTWVTTTLTFAVVVMFISWVSSERGEDFYTGVFGFLLICVGIIFTSRSFVELHDKTKNQAYLLIPASALEKTAAQILICTVGFTLYLVLFITVLSIVFEVTGWMVFGSNVETFNFLSSGVWQIMPLFVLLHACYFLGAAWFRKHHLIKTTLALSVIAIVLVVFSVMMLLLLYMPYLDEFDQLGEAVIMPMLDKYENLIRFGLKSLIVLLIMACWIIAWQRVAEAEVSNGV